MFSLPTIALFKITILVCCCAFGGTLASRMAADMYAGIKKIISRK